MKTATFIGLLLIICLAAPLGYWLAGTVHAQEVSPVPSPSQMSQQDIFAEIGLCHLQGKADGRYIGALIQKLNEQVAEIQRLKDQLKPKTEDAKKQP